MSDMVIEIPGNPIKVESVSSPAPDIEKVIAIIKRAK
jgi:hypothetical protein